MLKMYVLYDVVAERGAHIELCVNDAVASRMAAQALMATPPHMRGDFVLKCLGEYDEVLSSIVVYPDPYVVYFVVPDVVKEVKNEK